MYEAINYKIETKKKQHGMCCFFFYGALIWIKIINEIKNNLNKILTTSHF